MNKKNGEIEYILDDEKGIYTGRLKNNKPHGIGKIVFESGTYYEGQWENGLPNGIGKIVFFEGDVYEGQFKDNMMNGMGKHKDLYGYYEGQFKDDKKNGRGKFIYINGDIYEGEFKNSMRNGIGKYTWVNGEIYEGEFKDDMRNGRGKHKFKNGETHEGEYKDDRENGYGKITYPNGSVSLIKIENGNRKILKSRYNKNKYSKYLKHRLPNIKIDTDTDTDLDIESKQLYNKCYDFISGATYNIEKILDINPNKIILIYYDPRSVLNENNIFCYSYSYFKNILEDTNRHYYKCRGNYYRNDDSMGIGNKEHYVNDIIYVKIDLSFPVYIPMNELESIMEISHYTPYFYIMPKLDKDTNIQMEFSHTITKYLLESDNPNYVGEYHCQSGTNIKLYYVAVCNDPETCIKTFMKDIIEFKIMLENDDIDEELAIED
jgi:hypothetical protein